MGGYTELLEKLGMTKREGLEFVVDVLNKELEVNKTALRDARQELLRFEMTGRTGPWSRELKSEITDLEFEQRALMKEIARVKPELGALREGEG